MKKLTLKVLKRAFRRPFEWLGIGLGLLVFSNLSRKWMLRVCDFVSAVMYRFDKKGRCRSLANLRVILGKIKSEGIVRPEKVNNPPILSQYGANGGACVLDESQCYPAR